MNPLLTWIYKDKKGCMKMSLVKFSSYANEHPGKLVYKQFKNTTKQ